MVKSRNFFELFGPPCVNALPTLTVIYQNVRRSVPYILNHIWHRWEKQMVAVGSTNDTTSHFLSFNSPSPAPQGPMNPSTRCWDIAQKPPKCKNSPSTPIVTKNSFPPFSTARMPLTPKRGEDRVRPHANFGVNQPAVVEKSLTEQKKQKTYSKTSASVELTQTRH